MTRRSRPLNSSSRTVEPSRCNSTATRFRLTRRPVKCLLSPTSAPAPRSRPRCSRTVEFGALAPPRSLEIQWEPWSADSSSSRVNRRLIGTSLRATNTVEQRHASVACWVARMRRPPSLARPCRSRRGRIRALHRVAAEGRPRRKVEVGRRPPKWTMSRGLACRAPYRTWRYHRSCRLVIVDGPGPSDRLDKYTELYPIRVTWFTLGRTQRHRRRGIVARNHTTRRPRNRRQTMLLRFDGRPVAFRSGMRDMPTTIP